MTEENAKRLFQEWVRRLHLEGWRIHFEWCVPVHRMNTEDAVGCNAYQTESGYSLIQIMDESDYDNDIFPFDYEKTLVHELLHLKFAYLDDTGDALRDKLTHRMIEDMAIALVEAKRT